MTIVPAFTIRRATLADAAVITEYNRRLTKETENKELDLSLLVPGVLAALSDETRCRYFVAVAGDEVIGQVMVTYEWSDWRNGMIWWLQSVYVTASWRKRGVFGALFNHAIQAGKEAGAVGFRLYVEQDNAAAREVYRRLGMTPAGYLVMEYSDSHQSTIHLGRVSELARTDAAGV